MNTSVTNQKTTVLGIDLGTTNSTVSVARAESGGIVEIETLNVDQPTLQGTFTHTLVPSMVALANGQEWIGEGAKRLRGPQTEHLVSHFHDCKNDIGLKKTYHRAPEGYRSAAEIGGKVLQFLHAAANDDCDETFDRVVVTVPASFGANQREDTIRAAKLAGIELQGGDLLDEPVAAFIDYLTARPENVDLKPGDTKTLLVFDFGGGTCDIAIFRITGRSDGQLQIATLSVSRYHRLGGGDIDAAILHEVLVPQLLDQNGMSSFDIGYRDRKRQIEPALIGAAESLKIKLSEEVRRLQAFGKYEGADLTQIVVKQPGVTRLTVAGRDVSLNSPQLTAAQFEKLLQPFLDHDFLYARETEYRLTCSIFAPLQDAMDKADISPRAIDLCLMVGGSSQIPHVRQALDAYMPNARLLTYQDRDSVKMCVSRGAARHAFMLTTTGRALITPVCHDDVGIRTDQGAVTLVPKGTVLPYPAPDTRAEHRGLVVPRAVDEGDSCDLRVELVAGTERQCLFSAIWEIDGPIDKSTPLRLEYTFDENQVISLHLSVGNGQQAQEMSYRVEKPLSNTVNPHNQKEKALELEENLKTASQSAAQRMDGMVELASLYADLAQHDKAIDLLRAVLQKKTVPDAWLLNRIAILYGEKKDLEKQDKFYREAIALEGDWHGPSFNLALSLKNRNKNEAAAEVLDAVLTTYRGAPYLVLRAMVAEQMMEMKLRDSLLAEAKAAFGPPADLGRWELGWCQTCATMVSDEDLKQETQQELRKKIQSAGDKADGELTGELPSQMNIEGEQH